MSGQDIEVGYATRIHKCVVCQRSIALREMVQRHRGGIAHVDCALRERKFLQ